MKKITLALVVLVLALSLAACSQAPDTDALWADAAYTEDITLGEGAKTVTVTVTAGEKSVVITVKTDEAILGSALMAHGLIDGEAGQFGLYIKKVNGITADYDVDRSYWGLYKGGEYVMTGIDMTEFADGECYELVYEK